jgi:hypothetical protein
VKFFGENASTSEGLIETPRCGRCAHVLPDETLSFCPYCGIPFSRVPPTNSFELLASHREKLRLLVFRRKLFITTASLIVGLLMLCFGTTELYFLNQVEKLTAMRKIHFYFFDDTRYPSLTLYQKHEAIAIATESFQEHFGLALNQFVVTHDELPPELKDGWSWVNENHTQLSYWEKTFFPEQQKRWARDPYGELPVFITNFPIRADHPKESSIQTEHLSKNLLISGLGHPTFSLISTFRIFEEAKILFPNAKSSLAALQARYLGEYVIAHEMGHALLGLPDYTVLERDSGKSSTLRSPASVDLRAMPNEIDYSECIMHSDTGGGFKAWKELSARKMDEPLKNYCPEYVATIEAFMLRARAIELLKLDHRSEAEALHEQAIKKIGETTELWLAGLWKKEHPLFMNSLERWWVTFFSLSGSNRF